MISGGDILTTGAARTGYWALTFRTYPAEIKGGPCMYQVRVGVDERPLAGQRGRPADVLQPGGLRPPPPRARGRRPHRLRRGVGEGDARVRVALVRGARSAGIAQEAGGSRRGKNMVAVGLVCGLLGIDTHKIEEMILKRYAHKGDVGEANIRSLLAGAEHARDDASRRCASPRPAGRGGRRAGPALRQPGDLPRRPARRPRPTTPATRSRPPRTSSSGSPARLPRFGGVAIQTEDEIAALASVLGASFAGSEGDDRDLGPRPVADGRAASGSPAWPRSRP